MTDAATISAGLQSLKAAFDIGKALLNLGISIEIKTRVMEMNDRILTAQESAIASRDYQSTLLKQIGELEKQVADLEAWGTEAETYQLTDVRTKGHPMGSAFAYAPKEGTHLAEPPHLICANCYEERHKSILHQQDLNPGRCSTLICNRCGAILYREGTLEPEHGMSRSKPRNRR